MRRINTKTIAAALLAAGLVLGAIALVSADNDGSDGDLDDEVPQVTQLGEIHTQMPAAPRLAADPRHQER